MADKMLATDTYVTTEDGGSVVLPAGTKESEMDAKVKERITNESAWAVSALDDEEGTVDYKSMPVTELLKLAQDRGVTPTSNKKDDVVAALEADDATKSNAAVDDKT